MKAKRGQLTVFVIIGVVLVMGLGLFLYARSASVPKEEAVPADVAPIKMYVDQCLKQTAEDAVVIVALQGGYYLPPEKSLAILNFGIPHYLYEGDISVPTKEMIEKQLSLSMVSSLYPCMNLSIFSEKGYNITLDNPSAQTKITQKDILFDISFPLTVKISDKEYKMDKFSADVNAELINLYNAASEYMQYQGEDQNSLLTNKLMDIAYANGMTFEAVPFKGSILISLKQNKTIIKGYPLIFNFAVRYPQYDTNITAISMLAKK